MIPSGTRSAIWLAPRAFPCGSWQAGENHLLSLIAPLNSGERNGLYACVSISDAVLMNAVESAGRSPDTKYFLLSLNGDLIAGQPEETILEELQNQSDELRKATGNSPLSLSLNGMMITAVAVGLRPMAVCDVSAGKCILSKKQFVPEKCSACLYGSAHRYAFGVRHVGNENQLSVWKTG